ANCNVNLITPTLFTVPKVRRKYLKAKTLFAVCGLIRLIPESYPANRCGHESQFSIPVCRTLDSLRSGRRRDQRLFAADLLEMESTRSGVESQALSRDVRRDVFMPHASRFLKLRLLLSL